MKNEHRAKHRWYFEHEMSGENLQFVCCMLEYLKSVFSKDFIAVCPIGFCRGQFWSTHLSCMSKWHKTWRRQPKKYLGA